MSQKSIHHNYLFLDRQNKVLNQTLEDVSRHIILETVFETLLLQILVCQLLVFQKNH